MGVSQALAGDKVLKTGARAERDGMTGFDQSFAEGDVRLNIAP